MKEEAGIPSPPHCPLICVYLMKGPGTINPGVEPKIFLQWKFLLQYFKLDAMFVRPRHRWGMIQIIFISLNIITGIVIFSKQL